MVAGEVALLLVLGGVVIRMIVKHKGRMPSEREVRDKEMEFQRRAAGGPMGSIGKAQPGCICWTCLHRGADNDNPKH